MLWDIRHFTLPLQHAAWYSNVNFYGLEFLQWNLLLFGKSENPEMRRTDISVRKWHFVNNRPRSSLYPLPKNPDTSCGCTSETVRATFNNGPGIDWSQDSCWNKRSTFRDCCWYYRVRENGYTTEQTTCQLIELIAHDCWGWYNEHSCTGNNERFGFYCFIIHFINFK